MIRLDLADGTSLAAWRERAREALRRGIAPEEVNWQVGHDVGLFDVLHDVRPPSRHAAEIRVPRAFVSLAEPVLCHHDPQRHALLYRLLWRLTHGQPKLLEDLTDDDVRRARAMEKSVKRDVHKMRAFVRFREVARAGQAPVFVAWFEPEHYIVERNADFFVRRFAGMHWSILTPHRSAHWNGQELRFGDGATRADAPDGDALEDLWRRYYASIFNPARLKETAMRSEMPVKYWKNLPEAREIPNLIRGAHQRAAEMVAAAPTLPKRPAVSRPVQVEVPVAGDLQRLAREARDCRRCGLWQPATQTVFGEGPRDARIMLVGEQPGDQEDLAGRPFIGPAGQLLDRALAEIGLDRKTMYVTNTVKHFKFEPRGKRRLHARATAEEQAACSGWLGAELDTVQAPVVVALGAMAAAALFGRNFRLLDQRGQWQPLGAGRRGFATVHPAYLLRLPEDRREAAWRLFIDDLSRLAGL